MNRVGVFLKSLGSLVIVSSIPFTMAWCGVRMHNVPDMHYYLQQEKYNKILAETILVLILEIGAIGAVIAIGNPAATMRANRQARAYQEWKNKHVHLWKNCLCEDPKCSGSRHNLDNNCKCRNCSEILHSFTGPSVAGYFGSSVIESERCSRCGVEQLSSYYAG